MTATPNGEAKAAAPNPFEEAASAPETPEEPKKAPEAQETPKEPQKPAQKPAKTRTSKPKADKDPLVEHDQDKLPVSAQVGDVQVSVAKYVGQSILTVSLSGYIGEPDFRIRAEDAHHLEEALAAVREQLA